MFRLCFIVTCCILLLSCTSVPSKDPLTITIEQEQAQHDFGVFRDILEKAHPSLTESISEERKDFLFDSIYQTIGRDLSFREFYDKLSYLTNEICCSHTILSVPSAVIDSLYNRKLFFPVPVTILPEGVFANSEYDVPHGTKILAINNIPVARIFDSLTLYNPVDGLHRETQKYLSSRDFSYDYFVRFGGFDRFEIEAEDTSGLNRKIVLDAITLDEFNTRKNNRYYYDPADVPYSLFIDEEENYALLRITTFEYDSYNEQQSFESFLKNSFELLHKRNDIHTLVIDLRENGGGRLYNCFLLNSYLCRQPFTEYKCISAKIEKVPYTGFLSPDMDPKELETINTHLDEEFVTQGYRHRLFADRLIGRWEPDQNRFSKQVAIIINYEVMSSASYFALLAKNTAGAEIVGTESRGGNFCGSGFSHLRYVLPHTKFNLSFPYARIFYSYGSRKPHRGVVPDYYVPDNYEAFKNNQDKQMVFIKDSLMLKKK